MGDRGRGVVLYASAAALLAGGTIWWLRAAPPPTPRPSVEQWTATAQELLPDTPGQDHSGTVTLEAGTEHQVQADLEDGEFAVEFVCVGGPNSSVRVSLGQIGVDSGHGMACAGDVQPDRFKVGLAGHLRMNVSVGAAGPVVFRYSLLRAPTLGG
jgi:hypothetical protein